MKVATAIVFATAAVSQVFFSDAFMSRVARPQVYRKVSKKQVLIVRRPMNHERGTSNNIAITLNASEDKENDVEGDDSNMEDEDNYMGSNQYDEYEMAGQPQDAEMIEAMRLERIIANDRWQSCLIRDKQGGEWTGS
jgi:hypothetical protein